MWICGEWGVCKLKWKTVHSRGETTVKVEPYLEVLLWGSSTPSAYPITLPFQFE